jgi:hypothetical protein
MRTLIKLALFALVLNAAAHVVPVFWNYVKFRDAVAETAKFSSRRSERDVQERVLSIAQRFDVPVTLQQIAVRKHSDRTYVEMAYTKPLEYFPGRSYPMEFTVKVEGVPPPYAEVLP